MIPLKISGLRGRKKNVRKVVRSETTDSRCTCGVI